MNNKSISHFFPAFIFSVSILSCQLFGAPDGFITIEDKATLPILTPSLAGAKTAKIKLDNGLEAYIISDPNADQSAAAMTVRVGSWDDPNQYPGIAHFLEHMLFLGTKKYPNESEYDRFIKEHGGLTNAMTSNDFTSFMFSVNNDAFDKALDRFSHFFKDPLFNPSGVSRELQAIDQEYAQNVDNDDMREIHVLKQLANPAHPYHRFNIGNTSTLSKVSQETLKEWYREHYSANLMRLIVISTLPLEKLEELVVQDFKDVPSHEAKATDSTLPVFSKELNGKMIYIEPVKNIRSLMLVWDLPLEFSQMIETRPDSLLCYVLGHEGQESLLAELKKEKLAESLSCGSTKLGSHNLAYYLNVDLTDLGVHRVDNVIERIFQALAYFRQKGIPQYIFDDVQRTDKIRYQYKPRQDAFETVMQYAIEAAHEDMPSYPLYAEVIQKFDPKAVKELLDYLTPQNCHIDIVAPSSITGVKPDAKEPWMGVEYAVKPIPKAALDSWIDAKPFPGIDLPAQNPFIPQHLSLVNVPLKEEKELPIVPKPSLVLDNTRAKIYYALDDHYLSPKISWIFEIKTPSIEIGRAETVVQADLFVKSITEALSPISYPALMAGLNFDIKRIENGVAISIDGYSENASRLFEKILKGLLETQPSEQDFKVYKDSLLRDYQNASKELPIRQAFDALKKLIYKKYTTDKEKAIAIRKVTYKKHIEFVQTLFKQNYVQGVMYGNLTEKQAREVSESIPAILGGQAYPFKEQPKIEVIVMPEDKGPFYVENKIQVQGNAALLAIECPCFSFQKRAAQQILMQALNEPFFADLRTKQQTGYIVVSSGEEFEKELFNIFGVQSNTHDPRDLLARFELFIEGYLQELDDEITEERFAVFKNALLTNLSHPAKNSKEMCELLNRIAFKYDADFQWIEERIAGFTALQYKDFLTLAEQFLSRKNKRRAGILLKGVLPEENQFSYQRLSNFEQLRKISTFLSSGETKPQ